jgi:hypothetical protein
MDISFAKPFLGFVKGYCLARKTLPFVVHRWGDKGVQMTDKGAIMEARSAGRVVPDTAGRGTWSRRLSTETKSAFKTTEFWVMVVVVVAILVSAQSISGGDTAPGTDSFIAKQAWLYVAIVAVGYMVSRGLAKSGSREPYDDDRGNDHS